MFIWFVAAAVVMVALVFRSGAIDYRTVVVGALLPWGEVVFGGPALLHSMVGSVLVLVVVMALTQRRRLLRRRLLGIPIGMMCHLVLDGSFMDTEVFAWPLLGWERAPGQIPEVENLGRSLLLEAVGIGVALWAWKLFSLHDPARRERFRSDGRLDIPA